MKMACLLDRALLGTKLSQGGGSSALDRDFRRITRQIPLEDKRDLILQYGDEASKRRAHSIAADGKPADDGEKVGARLGNGGEWGGCGARAKKEGEGVLFLALVEASSCRRAVLPLSTGGQADHVLRGSETGVDETLSTSEHKITLRADSEGREGALSP